MQPIDAEKVSMLINGLREIADKHGIDMDKMESIISDLDDLCKRLQLD